IRSVAMGAQADATSGDTIPYTVTLTNVGHGAVTTSNISITMPDGSVQHPPAAQSVLAPGAVTTATASYAIPRAQASGPISATASVTWRSEERSCRERV